MVDRNYEDQEIKHIISDARSRWQYMLAPDRAPELTTTERIDRDITLSLADIAEQLLAEREHWHDVADDRKLLLERQSLISTTTEEIRREIVQVCSETGAINPTSLIAIVHGRLEPRGLENKIRTAMFALIADGKLTIDQDMKVVVQ